MSLIIHEHEGSRIVEYYPKEDAAPRISIVRSEISEITRLAGKTGNAFCSKSTEDSRWKVCRKGIECEKMR